MTIFQFVALYIAVLAAGTFGDARIVLICVSFGCLVMVLVEFIEKEKPKC